MYHSLAQFHQIFCVSFTFLLINDNVVLNKVSDDDDDDGGDVKC